MANYVYLLGCIEKSGAPRTYVGWTTDLDRRLNEHNTGRGAKRTKGRVWAMLYAERYKTRPEAMQREWYLKKDKAFRTAIRQNLITN